MSEATSHRPSSEELMREFQAQDAADLADELGTEGAQPSRTDSNREGGDKLSGYDDVLRWAENNPDQAPAGLAEFLKGQRQSFSRQGRELAGMREKLADIEGRLNANTPKPAPTPEEARRQAILQKIPAGQRESFMILANELGFVRKEEVAAERTEQSAASYSSQAQQEGIEKFGDAFGTLENGTFSWNEDVESKVRTVADRLTDDARGVTELDLYKIALFDDLLEQARHEGQTATAQERMGAIDMRQRAQTINGSARAGVTAPRIYEKGDKLSDVVARSVKLASGAR